MARNTDNALAIYVHIPFCVRKCPYCDFVSGPVVSEVRENHLEALHQEIVTSPWAGSPASTLFLGGGTPSDLSSQELSTTLTLLRSSFDFEAARELTIECNPGTVNTNKLRSFRDSGLNRVSIGIQSFRDAHLHTLGRIHDAAEARKVLAHARQAGFDNLSLDLMFAIPGQTVRDWELDLLEAFEHAPEHISLYNLTFEKDTEFFRRRQSGELTELSEDLAAEMFELAMDMTEAHGYRQYEISNFALPGRECLHNQAYWNGQDYLGFGLGAASFVNGSRWSNFRTYEEYSQAILSGQRPMTETERLTGLKALGEALMLALRTAAGADLGQLSEKYGIEAKAHYQAQIEFFQGEGLLEAKRNVLLLTRRGKLLADQVTLEFLE